MSLKGSTHRSSSSTGLLGTHCSLLLELSHFDLLARALHCAMNFQTERELKFSLMDDFLEEEALQVGLEAEGFSLGPQRVEVHRDVYFDTRRGHLMRAGLALRRRVIDGGAPLATLKAAGAAQGALHTRDELELPFEGEAWPREVRMKVAEVAPLISLKPIVALTTERTRYLIGRSKHLGGEEVAELSFDSVEATQQGGEMSVHFTELEVEALRADADLERIAGVLGKLLALTPSGVNKLERALALLSLGAWT